MSELTVREFAASPEFRNILTLIEGHDGQDNEVKVPYVQRAGLALTGFKDFMNKDQIQVFGRTEISYIEQLNEQKQEAVLRDYFDYGLAACILSADIVAPQKLLEEARRTATPIYNTILATHQFVEKIARYLEAYFAKTTSVHGVLLDVHGVGVLLLGKSGIGKSECALDLLLRGHRLVADDSVILKRIPPGIIRGQGNEIVKYHMEIRGLGVINVKELFGIAAIRDSKKIHMVVKLMEWSETTEYDRIGLEENYINFLDVELPLVILPVAPGRNLSAIIEVAAKNHLLKLEGFNAAQEFQKQLLSRMSRETTLSDWEEPE